MELQAEDGIPLPLPAERSSCLGTAAAGGPAASWSLELPDRGAGGAAGGASQPLQRAGFTQCLGHAAAGKTPAGHSCNPKLTFTIREELK